MSFDSFFASEYDRVVRSLLLAFGDRLTAEDAAQEAFSLALVPWSRVSQIDRPEAWVYVVALRYGRRRAKRLSLSSPPSFSGQDSGEETDFTNRIVIVDLLARLAPRQRQAVVLRYHADLTLEQVAAALGCRVGTVKATLNQALDRLRELSQGESLYGNH